jgi:hypothetical protein
MNYNEFEKQVNELMTTIFELLKSKSKEYNTSENIFSVFDNIAILEKREIKEVIRTLINLKVSRLNNDFKLDSLLDLINYSILLYVYLKEINYYE